MADGSTATLPDVDFLYDAIRKVGIARGQDANKRRWTLEFTARRDDDTMEIAISAPGRAAKKVVLGEDDFSFTDNTVTVKGVDGATLFMNPIYVKKLRGFTRGNIPTPDIAGPTLP